MKTALIRYSLVFAICLAVGEIFIFFTTQKYWPLALDDFIGVTALLTAIYINNKNNAAGYFLAAWCYIVGNLYAVLFMRLDPIHGNGERIELIVGVLIIAFIGLIASLLQYRIEAK